MTRLLKKAKEAYKRQGINYVIYSGAKIIHNFVYYMLFLRFRRPGTFTFRSKTYHYFYRYYNTTWKNERAVEVPIILEEVESHRRSRILEVGNVLSHYLHFEHDILDKYETGTGVINQDVVDFQSPSKYDLIVSISTLEHVGWDDEPRDPKKIVLAFQNLTECLAPGGELVFTLPIGYNAYLDKLLLAEHKVLVGDLCYLQRISGDNKWIEARKGEACQAKYNTPFPFANAVVIGTIRRSKEN